jgi:hypothetical protein
LEKHRDQIKKPGGKLLEFDGCPIMKSLINLFLRISGAYLPL